MSAAVNPQIQPKDGDRSVLPFPSAIKQSFKRILDNLEELAPQVVKDLESQTEDQLMDLWSDARTLGRHEWFLRCGVAAATWSQTQEAKRGRGQKDIAKKGILAAVSKRSKKMSITPSAVYRMAAIFRLINEVNSKNDTIAAENVIPKHNILSTLDEQGFWDHALNAADPVKAIFMFAARKEMPGRFRVTDAGRMVLTDPELNRKKAGLKAVEAVREETGQLTSRQLLINHIRSAQDVVKNLVIPGCPDKDFQVRVWDELLVELEEEYQELFDEDAGIALRQAWLDGSHREDELSTATNFPLADVSRLMSAMADMSEFIRIQPRDVGKRSTHQLWHMAGEPFDNAKFMPSTRQV